MSKERTVTPFLDDWNIREQSGDSRRNASGADSSGQVDGENYTGGVPYQWDADKVNEDGLTTEGGYGHSDAVKETQDYKAWGMSKDDVAAGYERPGSGGAKEPGVASYEQAIPDKNEFDRGAGSDSYAREHSETTGRGFDGRGRSESTSNPGGESMGSSKLVG